MREGQRQEIDITPALTKGWQINLAVIIHDAAQRLDVHNQSKA